MTAETEEERRSVEATLAWAALSGAWLAPGGSAPTREQAESPADLPILSSPSGGPLAAIREELGDCRRCRLHAGRTHIVFGVGNPEAAIMFVGEGPGEEEDRRGEPFVGRAGQLLDRMIAAIGYSRSDVYIANVVKCRPPQNRNPAEDEAATCMPFLREQIEAVSPAVICALGGVAAKALLSADEPISKLRGRPIDAFGRKVVPTFHPAFLLRSPEKKREAWADLKLVRELAERDG